MVCNSRWSRVSSSAGVFCPSSATNDVVRSVNNEAKAPGAVAVARVEPDAVSRAEVRRAERDTRWFDGV